MINNSSQENAYSELPIGWEHVMVASPIVAATLLFYKKYEKYCSLSVPVAIMQQESKERENLWVWKNVKTSIEYGISWIKRSHEVIENARDDVILKPLKQFYCCIHNANLLLTEEMVLINNTGNEKGDNMDEWTQSIEELRQGFEYMNVIKAVTELQNSILLSVNIVLIKQRTKKVIKKTKSILQPFNVNKLEDKLDRNLRGFQFGSREWLHDEVEKWIHNDSRMFWLRMYPGKL